MEKYCVIERGLTEHHAGAKARRDAAEFLTENGWTPLTVHHSEEKGTIDKLYMAWKTYADWRMILHTVPEGASLFIQYPLAMYPKVSRVALPFIRRLREKKVTVIYLVHDLDSLRGLNEEGDRMFLNEADGLIVHNDIMAEEIRRLGYPDKPMVPIGLFDYRIPGGAVSGCTEDKRSVVVAGNLKPEKAGYLRDLGEIGGEVRFCLYGPNFSREQLPDNIKYEGEFSPEELPSYLHGGFGLVWDGDEIDSCSGTFGEYLKYNNPHKASLYLASGLPVIVWKEAALAPFIEQIGAGIAVSSLRELPAVLAGMEERQYEKMRTVVSRIAQNLRSGQMLKQALETLERMLSCS